ncbi:MAG: CBS domain-containing protein [Dehalococcoidia bacterium]
MKTITVKEIYSPTDSCYLCFQENAPITGIAEKFAHDPSLRAVFLTDSKGKFTGMVRRSDMMKWLYLQIYGKVGGGDVSTGDAIQFTLAKEAIDIARGNADSIGVKPEDTLQKALDKMIAHKESIVPVLDNEDKILGDLRASTVLKKALEMWEKEKKD